MRWTRPAITGVLVLAMVAGFFIGRISPEVFVPFVGIALTWLFKARDDDKKNGGQ